MHRSIIAGVLSLAALWPAAALAQADSNVGEIVVTASRINGGDDDSPASLAMRQPHVVVFHRADNLIVNLQVECDTRDQSERIAELKATLRNVAGAATADGTIELGVQDEDAGVVVPFRIEALETMLSPGARVDTSRVTITVKTKIRDGDSFEAATGRIDGFIRKIKPVGRAQATRDGDWQMTILSPRQYRVQVVAAIAKDANETAAALGADYRVQLTGLERPISWSRSGPLELALYIPYAMTVTPAPR
jgi:hypothetical protein